VLANAAVFEEPTPPLAGITEAIDLLETTYQSGLSGDHAAKKLARQQRQSVNVLMVELKSYVQITAGDDAHQATLSGIDLPQAS